MEQTLGESTRWRVIFAIVLLLLLVSAQQVQARTSQEVAGDATVGRTLFEGGARMDNGGPPCLGCHSVAGIGALGGGLLGPDLTGAFDKFGEAGLASILATTPFATMNPIFAGRPLTADEQADLLAFLEGVAVTEREASSIGQLALIGLVGAVILLFGTRYFWSRRVTAVRRPMVARAAASISKEPSARPMS